MQFKPIAFDTEKFSYCYYTGAVNSATLACCTKGKYTPEDMHWSMCILSNRFELMNIADDEKRPEMKVCIEDFVNNAVPYYKKMFTGVSYTLLVNKITKVGVVIQNFNSEAYHDFIVGKDFIVTANTVDVSVLFNQVQPSVLDMLYNMHNENSLFCAIDVHVVGMNRNVIELQNVSIHTESLDIIDSLTSGDGYVKFIPAEEMYLSGYYGDITIQK